jgi:hypothetical protein
MSEAVTISAAKPTVKGLDYDDLQAEAIATVQALSGDIWTDYNEHDPGVTILEQLSYGLTELSYRALLPIESILTDEKTGKIDAKRQALYRPELILPCNPVTVNDYRKLILDRFPRIANVWLRAYPAGEVHGLKGLYQIFIYGPDLDPCSCHESDRPSHIIESVERLYNRHRGVCEDLQGVFLLAPVITKVEAKVIISAGVVPSILMANLLFQIGLTIAPVIGRSNLSPWLDRGVTTAELFNGPLMLNGLIDEAQLQDKASCVPMADVIRAMLDVVGVTGVRDVKACVPEFGACYTSAEAIPVAFEQILKLDLSPMSAIRLYQEGQPVEVDPEWVLLVLYTLWDDYRQTYDMGEEYRQYFDMPTGEVRQFRQYYSIQNQFPALYGINEYGIASSAPVARQAQAKQLKGYLLVFDQLLANYFAQLANTKDLFSVDRTLEQTYFYQYLYRSVPNLEPLLKQSPNEPNYSDGLPRLVQSQDPVYARRDRFLNFLLAMYCQTLDGDATADTITAKLDWLTHLVEGTGMRGKAMDYLADFDPHNTAGLLLKTRIELGMPPYAGQSLQQHCTQLAVTLVSCDQDASLGRWDSVLPWNLPGHFTAIHPAQLQQQDTQGQTVNANLLQGQRLTDTFMLAGADSGNYWLGHDKQSNRVILVCQSPEDSAATMSQPSRRWLFVGEYQDHQGALAAVVSLVRHLQQLANSCQQVYLVEHLLLRYALADTSGLGEARQTFVYNFTLSAIVCTKRSLRHSRDYRQWVRDTVRRNTPAHLCLNYCFLTPGELIVFEGHYWAWRQALKSADSQRRQITSVALRDYLQVHTAADVDGSPKD